MASVPTGVEVSAPLTPPTTSLLTAARVVEGGDWRENGFEVEGVGCGSAGAWDETCGAESDKEFPANDFDHTSFLPYVVYATDVCSTWGYGTVEDRERRNVRLTRNLAASQSFVIEQELWGDTLGLGNPKIADTADVTFSTALPVLKGVAEIEDSAGDLAKGVQLFIHMRPYQFTLLASSQILRLVDGRWITPMGSVVVPGRGYAGTGPAGQAKSATEEWIYGTSAVEVRLGKILDVRSPQDTVDRSTNDVRLLTERKAVAVFDPNCVRIAVKVSR